MVVRLSALCAGKLVVKLSSVNTDFVHHNPYIFAKIKFFIHLYYSLVIGIYIDNIKTDGVCAEHLKNK
jgi:hypothetical protein